MIIQGVFVSWIAGVAVSFKPCVYPVIPVTAAFIAGVNLSGSRTRGLMLSLIYVFGLTLGYTTLAVISALSGRFFGWQQTHPLTWLIVGTVLAGFAVMMGMEGTPLRTFHVPWRIQEPRHVGHIFIAGVVASLIVGPCTAPVLGSLLVYIQQKSNVLLGMVMMAAFAFGVGTSLILVGTFSSLLTHWRRLHPLTSWIRRGCAAVLGLLALYYFHRAWGLFTGSGR